MSHWLANRFIALRNARAWMTAIGLFAVLLWALWNKPAERVEYRELTGELLSVSEVLQSKNSPSQYMGTVLLPDGTQTKLMLSPRRPVPVKGNQIPLIFERYADGKILYSFDNTRWIADGGAH